jgi:hypothetical protein
LGFVSWDLGFKPRAFLLLHFYPVTLSFLFRRHLEEDETLLRAVHKHWLFGIKALLWPTIWFLVCLIPVYASQARPLILISASLCIGVLVWWLRNFFDYYLDAWLITDQGIIDIAWHGWFHRESTRVLYSDIQGVAYEIHGVASTLLRYGTITVEKVSTGTAISLPHVFNPRSVETLILKNAEKYLQAKNLKDADQVKERLSALVAHHVQLNSLPVADEDE